MVYSACLVTPGSESRANGHEDSPGNLGDPVVSIVPAGRSPAYQLQADPRLAVPSRGDEPGTKRWYRQAKETKCGETDGRESECRDGRQYVPLGGEDPAPARGPRRSVRRS